jgi:hypothetical protein
LKVLAAARLAQGAQDVLQAAAVVGPRIKPSTPAAIAIVGWSA